MKKIKKFNFTFISIISLFLILIIITLLNFIGVFGETFSNVLIFISIFVVLILNNFYISKKNQSKGIVTGLKIASIVSFLIILFKILFNIKFSYLSFIYITLIYIFSIISSIYGKNIKSSSV